MSLTCSVGRRGEQLGGPDKPAAGRNVRAVKQEDEEGREPDELRVFVFGKIVSQMFPALGTSVANSGNLPLQSVCSFYQSAFTDL